MEHDWIITIFRPSDVGTGIHVVAQFGPMAEEEADWWAEEHQHDWPDDHTIFINTLDGVPRSIVERRQQQS